MSLEDINPLVGLKLSKRFMTAMGLVADVVEYLDHVINFNDTKDTLLFLLIATVILYTIRYCFIYLPLIFIIKILYVSALSKEYPKRNLDFKRSYRIIQRIMRDTSEMVEFYDLFMSEYVYWNDGEKTMKLLTELSKLIVLGVGAIFIQLNHLLIIVLWYKIFERSHFFWCLLTIIKNFNREMAQKTFGIKYRHIFDPPLESLIDSLKKEDNNFSKKIHFLFFDIKFLTIVRDALRPFEIIDNEAENETASHDSGDESPAFFKKLFNSKKKSKKRMKVKKNNLLSNSTELRKRNLSDKDDSDTPLGDVIKRKIDQFKKFTKEIFGDKANKEKIFVDEVRAVVSDEDDLNEEMTLKRAIIRQLAIQSKQVKKRLIQVKQK